MKNTTYIPVSETVLFDNVINEKRNPRKALLLGIQGRVNGYYATYLTGFGALQNQTRSAISRTEINEKEGLNHCFEVSTASFKPIRGQIKAAQNNLLKILCPYCLLNEWDTLDHYIPKASFPEYSILVRNLVPCCSQCNKLKAEKWRTGTQRRIIHFYNDNFLNNRFLYGKITVNRITQLPSIRFYLSPPVGMSAYNFSIIKFHFKDLNLLNRYTDLANAVISSNVEIIENHIANGINNIVDLTSSLLESYDALARVYSINYYESIVFEAFANNTSYLRSFF